jgi:hypothetical protein
MILKPRFLDFTLDKERRKFMINMKILRHEINNIIPQDDLKWNETEQRFCILSDEEINILMQAWLERLTKNKSKEEIEKLQEEIEFNTDEMYKTAEKFIRWAENKRTGNILLEKILNGTIGMFMNPENEEPFFYSKDMDE